MILFLDKFFKNLPYALVIIFFVTSSEAQYDDYKEEVKYLKNPKNITQADFDKRLRNFILAPSDVYSSVNKPFAEKDITALGNYFDGIGESSYAIGIFQEYEDGTARVPNIYGVPIEKISEEAKNAYRTYGGLKEFEGLLALNHIQDHRVTAESILKLLNKSDNSQYFRRVDQIYAILLANRKASQVFKMPKILTKLSDSVGKVSPKIRMGLLKSFEQRGLTRREISHFLRKIAKSMITEMGKPGTLVNLSSSEGINWATTLQYLEPEDLESKSLVKNLIEWRSQELEFSKIYYSSWQTHLYPYQKITLSKESVINGKLKIGSVYDNLKYSFGANDREGAPLSKLSGSAEGDVFTANRYLKLKSSLGQEASKIQALPSKLRMMVEERMYKPVLAADIAGLVAQFRTTTQEVVQQLLNEGINDVPKTLEPASGFLLYGSQPKEIIGRSGVKVTFYPEGEKGFIGQLLDAYGERWPKGFDHFELKKGTKELNHILKNGVIPISYKPFVEDITKVIESNPELEEAALQYTKSSLFKLTDPARSKSFAKLANALKYLKLPNGCLGAAKKAY